MRANPEKIKKPKKIPSAKEPPKVKNLGQLADELEEQIKASPVVERLRRENERIVIDPVNVVYRQRQIEVMVAFLPDRVNQATFMLLVFPWTQLQKGLPDEYVDAKFERAAKILKLVNEAGIYDEKSAIGNDESMVLKI